MSDFLQRPLIMKLTDNDFDLFGVPVRFAQERAQLDARWKALQSEVHPDRFASEGAAAQRVAMQWAIRVNEAYQRLKDPLKRGAYLCELHGAAIDAGSNTAMPGAFLMLRETQAPPIALLRQHGARMAVATDCNPGTSPVASMTAAISASTAP